MMGKQFEYENKRVVTFIKDKIVWFDLEDIENMFYLKADSKEIPEKISGFIFNNSMKLNSSIDCEETPVINDYPNGDKIYINIAGVMKIAEFSEIESDIKQKYIDWITNTVIPFSYEYETKDDTKIETTMEDNRYASITMIGHKIFVNESSSNDKGFILKQKLYDNIKSALSTDSPIVNNVKAIEEKAVELTLRQIEDNFNLVPKEKSEDYIIIDDISQDWTTYCFIEDSKSFIIGIKSKKEECNCANCKA